MTKLSGDISRSAYIALAILAGLWTAGAIIAVWTTWNIDRELARSIGRVFGIGTLVALVVAGASLGLVKAFGRADAQKQVAYTKIARLVYAVLIFANALLAIVSHFR